MKKITTLIFCAIALFSSAQSLKIEKIVDDPNFSNLAIRPGIAIDLGLKAGWGAGLGIDAEYSNEGLPVQFRASLHQNFIGSQNIDSTNKPLRGIEVGVAYAVVNKNTTKTMRVVLKASQVSSTTTNVTYTNYEGTVNKQILIRAGFYNHRSNWESGGVADSDPILINGNSTFMKGNTSATGVYAGMGIQTRKNLQINTDVYGKARKTSHSQIYLDLLIAPAVGLGEWTDANGSVGPGGTTYMINDESSAETKNLGWRFGWLYNPVNASSNGTSGWYFKMEAGSRPALKGQGAFFISYLGYAFNKG